MSNRVKLAIGGGLLVILAWAFWSMRRAPVMNLGSHGRNIIAFGDSLTAGYGAAAGEDYPSRVSVAINAEIRNAGVNGDTTESALARIENDVLSQDPRIVIVGLGGNDFLRGVPIADTERNLSSIVRRIHGAGAMVILLGFDFPRIRGDYESMYERVAETTGAELIPDVTDGILTNASLKSDEIHPNSKGYQLMADRVAGPLEKLIAQAPKR